MAPRTGRPPSDESRTERISLRVSKADKELAESAFSKDAKQDETFSAWASRTFSDLVRKLSKK